jgi:serine/threonine protein kinase
MIGRRLAHYDITAHLGSSGMADVYQAIDSKLGRSVALKFLPEAFARDTDRAARFTREAKALASLNHPRIAAIYGIEEAEGRSFLVMELVPGQTLAERIGRGPLGLDEVLGIARQIAEALEAAHDKGIIHRDLKPANVKIAPDGQVKVLDFGLAKLAAEEAEAAGEQLADAPTVTAPATSPGIILGTAAYMAPEQATGLPVDRRADLFAFGCVLYEMLTGRPAFEGESVPDILSRVLQRDPDWTCMPSSVTPAMFHLLRLCLEKDPKKRRQSAGDVRIDLEHAPAALEATPTLVRDRGSRLARLAWIAGTVTLIAALAIPATRYLRESAPPEMRLQIVTPPSRQPLYFALSPDGRYVVFASSGLWSGAPDRLYLRALDTTDTKPIAGIEEARLPFWSPDSRSVGFFASRKLYRIDIAGGPAQALASASNPIGGTWNADGTILFAPDSTSPLIRVPAAGGEAVAATTLDAPRQTSHRQPSFLPDGRRFLFHGFGADPDVSGLYLGSLDGGAPKRLVAADAGGALLAPDRIIYLQGGALIARRFDPARGVVIGAPVSVASPVGEFSVSATGIVAHRAPAGNQSRMAWFDRTGNNLGEFAEVFNGPELSPDDRRLAGGHLRGHAAIDVLELCITIRMRGPLTRLAVGLQAVAHFVQEYCNHPVARGVPGLSERPSQAPCAQGRPTQWALRIPRASPARPIE